jgi:hypothetical protein
VIVALLRLIVGCLAVLLLFTQGARGEGEWEITADSAKSLQRGLEWLVRNQGPEGNWTSNDLGLVSMGGLAFMSAGHAPGRGRYGDEVQKSLDYVLNSARPTGLLNISHAQRDMYNHGLSTFVLGQTHGMTTSRDQRLNAILDRALRLIALTQCDDGGWDYQARRSARGHDLSLAVMQAKALRSAMDSGLDVSSDVVDKAIRSVREHYAPRGARRDARESEMRELPGQFTYSKGGGGTTIAMAAAGVVCLQEFGQYDDWRIPKNMEVIGAAIDELAPPSNRNGTMPFDAYTLYYVGQALYQVGGDDWQRYYPKLRDYLVATQRNEKDRQDFNGSWKDLGASGRGRVSGKPGDLYATAVACFVLAMPNRYLPILQEGRIESLQRPEGNSGR